MEAAENGIVRIQPAPLARPLEFSADQRQMVRDSIANGMNESEFTIFMEVARTRNLNPITRQITPIARFDNKKGRDVWSYQVTIDGLRCIAERTGRYEGQTAPQWCGKDGVWVDVWLKSEPPTAARVGVYRHGFREALVAVARWESYVPAGNKAFMWNKMPDLMISKCAEALALRKAFPEDMSGLYTEDEMAQAEKPEAKGEAITVEHRRIETPKPQPKEEAKPEAPKPAADPLLAKRQAVWAKAQKHGITPAGLADWVEHFLVSRNPWSAWTAEDIQKLDANLQAPAAAPAAPADIPY